MEGGRTQQQQPQQQQPVPPPASARWLQFADWLRQQAGVPPAGTEEAVSEASTSDAEDGDLPADPSSTPSSSRGGSLLAARSAASASSPPPVTPGQLARHATLAPRLRDCRAEMRLTSDSSSRARQEMTVVLAAPGMPLHQAPVLTCKQASALMSAICEPLLSLPVGRLTRKLSAPTRLQPTEDRGLLSLWLLPDDSLSLVWQSVQQLQPAALDATAGPSSSSSSADRSNDCSGSADRSSSIEGEAGGRPRLPTLRQSCSVAVWEELAHFPAIAHLLDDTPVVTIHMLRGDTSGRSFYIRVRNDVAEANLEAATAAVPDASRLLQQQRAAAEAAGSSVALSAAAEAEAAGAPRMYFWLTDRDLGKAVYSLGRLKSLLKRPPTLAKRSGVPERQLLQLGAWVQQADVAAAEQQRLALAAAQQQQLGEQQELQAAGDFETSAGPSSSNSGSRPPGAVGPLSPLLHPPGPGLLLGQAGMAAAAQMQGSMATLLPSAGDSAAATAGSTGSPAGSDAGSSGGADEAAEAPCASSTVSATAAALYQDHRFNLVCPCTISVVVGMKVQAPGADPALLPVEASQRARTVAERQAKAAVDRSGRQRIEERLAEVVIRNIRAQRNRARAARQQQRDSAVRAAQAERALALARQATGRSVPEPAAGVPMSLLAPSAVAAVPFQCSQQEQLPLAASWPPPTRSSSTPPTNPFALPGTAVGSTAQPRQAAAVFGGAPKSLTPLGSGNCSASKPNPQTFSSPARLPATPALLPGGRVTIENLQSLLSPPGLEAGNSGGAGRAVGELGAAAASAAPASPDARSSTPDAAPASLSIAELAALLGKHAKLE